MLKFFLKKKKPGPVSQDSSTQVRFREKYIAFQLLLHENNNALEIMADIEEKMTGEYLFDINYIAERASAVSESMSRLIGHLNDLSHNRYAVLHKSYESIRARIDAALQSRIEIPPADDVISLQKIQADMTLVAGGKMANLGEIRTSLGIPVPEGFVVTSSAFKRFVEHSQLQEKLSSSLSGLNIKNMIEIQEASRAIQEMIISAELPVEVERHIREAALELFSISRQKQGFSVRSSAIFEDGDFSFAGQYETLLHVKPDSIIRSYKTVVASLFSPRAIYYAKTKGFSEGDMVMAVGVMEMVSARAGGVLYTRDPNGPDRNVMIINGVWGLAKAVVDGKMKTDTFVIERNSGALLEADIGEKSHKITAGIDNGIHIVDVEERLRNEPCLTATEIGELVRYALDLESHYGKPQDIEWAVSDIGEVFILQTRPLRLMKQEKVSAIPRRVDGFTVLIDKGVIASRGIGAGPVYFVRSDDDLQGFPEGAVLVSKATSTRFVTVMDRAAAIITDIGGATGHMASLAREYQIPAILNTDSATRVLQQGQEITVDAFHCTVYEGRVPELIDYAAQKKKIFQETNLFHMLDRVLKHIVPLHLYDPEAVSFTPGHCITYHDITRFAHEKAMAEMFGLSDTDSMEKEETISLKAGIPVDAHILDVGGGVREGTRKATPEDILSVPFVPFLKGMMAMKWPQSRAADAKGFFSMMAHTASIPEAQLQETALRSFAILSDRYMNFSIRLGYHFSMVEAFAGDTLNDNYIKFFFKGGGAAADRRLRRVRLISELLEMMDFRVKVTEDVISAVLLKFNRPEIEKRLEIMGKLTAFTKQLDMAMFNEDITDWYRDEFVRDHMKSLEMG